MSISQYMKLNQDSGAFRKNIGSYNPATPFFKAIFDACRFDKFNSQVSNEPIRLMDAMSGPGKLGKDILKMYNEQKPESGKDLHVFFNDKLDDPLSLLTREGFDTIKCDVRELGGSSQKFDIIAVRYGLKDLPKDQIPLALNSLRASLLPDGLLVIGDMTAYTPNGQRSVIKLHSAKQELAGRDSKTEGICHIPTVGEWERLLVNSNFSNLKTYTNFTSDVETSQWKGQFGSKDTPEKTAIEQDMEFIDRLNDLTHELAKSSPTFCNEFKTNFSADGKVFIKFPIVVISGEKRQ